ncbi:sigma-70 family RNA polymerase sigma factor [Streptomyces alkaliterrae]|uniref:RNA polymerase sigma factor n=1 Tax=Streptomyces alkaliterrae TaxID=2213162 RepID=A0A5P0YZZ5_9ACTN|nr:sigma-70 family RNA polymerase sigma factor [Streptomyces alkaliterrae]MBB1255810.1 sigma-70 family RNA polymerase sigma factor [Streptomyces alkaliterrae]MBB1261840.1 sigma-70 family RNA polymerase sigma factor [Streptomyces alkaliterrae]MQS04509.1 sigma-70 family RNA polymerase sigma factor [Streptomyces alkaliterrae]
MRENQQLKEEEFPRLADPYRRELLAHCYRMLGSVHDAEDLVQETYLRAWRAYDNFEGRSSMRTWLHRIATNTCLDALESRKRRPLPTGLGSPNSDPSDVLAQRTEVDWLEPVQDAMVGAEGDDPATIVTSKESIRLAFVAALQHLPPRQRAVLLLRDVMRWKAAEVAELMETSTASVNSALQRARAQLKEVTPTEESVSPPTTAEQRELLERYVVAFERKDIAAIVDLFTSDAVWEMPPFLSWYQGPTDIGELIRTSCPAGPGDMRLIPAELNGQPSFALYLREGGNGPFQPWNLHVLSLREGAVSHVVAFFDRALFDKFGLPAEIPA